MGHRRARLCALANGDSGRCACVRRDNYLHVGFYIGFPTIFNPVGAIPPPETNYTRINQIEMTVSRDLYHWERVADRALFIALEPFDGDVCGTIVTKLFELKGEDVYINADATWGEIYSEIIDAETQ